MVWRLCNVAYNGSRRARQRRIRAEDRAMIFSLTPQRGVLDGCHERKCNELESAISSFFGSLDRFRR